MKYRIIITLVLLLILGGLVVMTADYTTTPSQTSTKMAPPDKTTQSLKDLKLN